ncbi:GGDEF domain-containing protein [Vibrio ponticus]|uniref:diguanylate cyclase n=1 Tax=Vibrio ponticus TaxID=265668 RepID=A0A3N3DYR3_9VIBR|nr:GGDEF domain-containing protein [Vibrio ponticus]ROV59657.1 GGDEF domain-containing protein [Vibrio ponticus]
MLYTQIQSSYERQQYLESISKLQILGSKQFSHWLEWIEQSHTEPHVVAQELKQQLGVIELNTPRAKGYLHVLLSNLDREVDEPWIDEELARISPNTKDIAWLPILLSAEQAIQLWYGNDSAQALLHLESLVARAVSEKHNILLPKLFYWSGNIALINNEILQAQKYLLKSIHYTERYDNLFYKSKSYHALALTYIVMEDWSRALGCIQKARRISEKWPNVDHNTSQLYWYNESFILAKLGKVKEAEYAYQQSHLHFLKDTQSLRHKVLDVRGAVTIALLKQDFPLAEQLIDRCIAISLPINYLYSLGRCNFKRAELNLVQREHQSALEAAELSAKYFSLARRKASVIKALNLKAQIYQQMGDSSQAYALAKKAHLIEKQQLQSKLRDLTHAQETFELAKQRDEMTYEQQAKDERLYQNRLSLYWALSISVALSITIALLYFRTQMIKRENARLEHYSSVDSLTGLHNRHYYYQRLATGETIDIAMQYHIVLLDIDHFKSINDTHGHLIGDEVLQQLALRVNQWKKGKELFVRWGGEEFLWLVQADEYAKERIDRACQAVCNTPFITSKGELAVTTSIGVSSAALPEQILANENIFLEADGNLYRAKRGGRNQVVWSASS